MLEHSQQDKMRRHASSPPATMADCPVQSSSPAPTPPPPSVPPSPAEAPSLSTSSLTPTKARGTSTSAFLSDLMSQRVRRRASLAQTEAQSLSSAARMQRVERAMLSDVEQDARHEILVQEQDAYGHYLIPYYTLMLDYLRKEKEDAEASAVLLARAMSEGRQSPGSTMGWEPSRASFVSFPRDSFAQKPLPRLGALTKDSVTTPHCREGVRTSNDSGNRRYSATSPLSQAAGESSLPRFAMLASDEEVDVEGDARPLPQRAGARASAAAVPPLSRSMFDVVQVTPTRSRVVSPIPSLNSPDNSVPRSQGRRSNLGHSQSDGSPLFNHALSRDLYRPPTHLAGVSSTTAAMSHGPPDGIDSSASSSAASSGNLSATAQPHARPQRCHSGNNQGCGTLTPTKAASAEYGAQSKSLQGPSPSSSNTRRKEFEDGCLTPSLRKQTGVETECEVPQPSLASIPSPYAASGSGASTIASHTASLSPSQLSRLLQRGSSILMAQESVQRAQVEAAESFGAMQIARVRAFLKTRGTV